MVLSLVVLLTSGSSPLGASTTAILGGVVLALLFTLPGYFSRRLGAGDVKMLLAIALLGGALAVLWSFAIGSLLTVGMALAWRQFGPGLGFGLPVPGRSLPLGTGMAVGFIVVLISGQTGGIPWSH